jgi:hypothetical protein
VENHVEPVVIIVEMWDCLVEIGTGFKWRYWSRLGFHIRDVEELC